MKQTCIGCNGTDFESIYMGTLRAGSPGKNTKEKHNVIKCVGCELAKLEVFPSVDYDSSSYRESYNDTSLVEDYMEMHDHEQSRRLFKIGLDKFRGKVVLDYGTGGGAFLDAVKGVAKKTIAIEPFTGYHPSLKKRGHEVFTYAEEAHNYIGKIDVVTSFGVIEHVNDPLVMLKHIHQFLNNTGLSYIETDNLNDVLTQFNMGEFEEFYYRTAHYWYFNSSALSNLCSQAGFTDVQQGFLHNYNLSNTLHWLKDKQPRGDIDFDFISPMCDEAWKKSLELSGMAELLFFELRK